MNATNQELVAKVSELEYQVEELSSEVNELNTRVEDLTYANQSLKTEVANLSFERDNLKNTVETKTEQLEKAVKELKLLDNDEIITFLN